MATIFRDDPDASEITVLEVSKMENRANLVAVMFSTLGVLFMLAMAFKIMPWNYAIFAGVACFILAGAVKRVDSQTRR